MVDLPTEAMWEYACRAGTVTALNNGKNLSDVNKCSEIAEVGRYSFNHDDGKGGSDWITKVGMYQPNAWGLYDMHGNSPEWCLEGLGNLGTAAVVDPKGPKGGNSRVIRSGSGSSNAAGCRSASRGSAYTWNSSGIRLCCFASN